MAGLAKMVRAIRKRCQWTRIIVRGDSAFAREEIRVWCEAQKPGVYYCLGLGPNSRLVAMLQDALATARGRRCLTGAPSAREFKDLAYRTRQSWSRSRRGVGKAEVMGGGDNPRFIVTNLPREGFRGEDRERLGAARLYEELDCARGDRENQLKQPVLDWRADRMSTHYWASNPLRLWLATLAYLLLDRMRTLGLRGTELARATAGTIRTRGLKVAAQVRVSGRRIYVQMSSAFVGQDLFRHCARRLAAAFPQPHRRQKSQKPWPQAGAGEGSSKEAPNQGVATAQAPNHRGATAISQNEGSELRADAINPSLRVARHWSMKRPG